MAQDNGMGSHNGNSSGNYSFSGTQMLLGAILIVLIVAVVLWVSNNRRNRQLAGLLQMDEKESLPEGCKNL